MTKRSDMPRGRPREFDAEAALAAGQRLFHARGYDAVGVAALTGELGINPPSFYAAYGNKAGFFGRVVARYVATVLSLDDILRPGRAAAEALAELLDQAARTYAADPEARGCLVLEAARGGGDPESVRLARVVAEDRRACLRAFVAGTHPAVADRVTDFVASTMSGLSASAREGMDTRRLCAVAAVAARAIGPLLEETSV